MDINTLASLLCTLVRKRRQFNPDLESISIGDPTGECLVLVSITRRRTQAIEAALRDALPAGAKDIVADVLHERVALLEAQLRSLGVEPATLDA